MKEAKLIKVIRKWKKQRNLFLVAIAVSMLAIGCNKPADNKQKENQIPETKEHDSRQEALNQPETIEEDFENTTGFPTQIPAFTAKDLEGNTITENIFAEKDLTVVNIWGTFCMPCVGEMPELGEWAKTMPDNVQIIGLICDIAGENDTEHHDLAVTITEKAGVEFTNIIANEDWNDIMSWVIGVPTTLFVDKNGAIVGNPIVGADVEGYKEFVEDYLAGQ